MQILYSGDEAVFLVERVYIAAKGADLGAKVLGMTPDKDRRLALSVSGLLDEVSRGAVAVEGHNHGWAPLEYLVVEALVDSHALGLCGDSDLKIRVRQ